MYLIDTVNDHSNGILFRFALYMKAKQNRIKTQNIINICSLYLPYFADTAIGKYSSFVRSEMIFINKSCVCCIFSVDIRNPNLSKCKINLVFFSFCIIITHCHIYCFMYRYLIFVCARVNGLWVCASNGLPYRVLKFSSFLALLMAHKQTSNYMRYAQMVDHQQ